MLKIENYEVVGWEHAIRGMRNPMNSWEKSDSLFCMKMDGCDICPYFEDVTCPGERCYSGEIGVMGEIGPNDHQLMTSLAKGGPVHAKYRRMITVYLDITAPLYWWKEFDTYKVGTVANSCSTMHKIHAKEFTLEDFSCEHLDIRCKPLLQTIINTLNDYRKLFIEYNPADFEIPGCPSKKDFWWQMIQLLPTSYNQKRTVMLNYEVLHNIYHSRKNHKLDEWHVFCDWINGLPYSEIIIGGEEE